MARNQVEMERGYSTVRDKPETTSKAIVRAKSKK